MSDFYYKPGTVVVPTDDYIEELRNRVRGNIAQVALFEQYVTMVADLQEKLGQGDPQSELDRLAWQIGIAQKEMERE